MVQIMPQILIKSGTNPTDTEVWWDDQLVGVFKQHDEAFRKCARELMAKQLILHEEEKLRQQTHQPQTHSDDSLEQNVERILVLG